MEQFFSVNGKLSDWLGRIADLALLNLLWLICCIPVVTVGASTAALYSVEFQMVKNQDGYVARSFFSAFRENFVQATVIWLGMLLCGTVLYFDFYYSSHTDSFGAKIMVIPFLLAAFLMFATGCYAFPVLAYFKNTTKGAVKNALLMALAHLPCTFGAGLLSLAPFLVLFVPGIPLFLGLFADMILGAALCAWGNVHLFYKLFQRYHPRKEKEES